jgi:cytochrome P450
VLISDTTEIPTFLLGGHETTSTLMSWVLLQLASNPSVQAALRDECRANPLPAASPDFESSPLDADELSSLDKLPLLDAVIRETLRLHPPVTNVGRAAVKDDIIPLTRPFVNRDGVVQDTITIKKHDAIYVPIILINQSVELWGTDAEEWKPERWMAGHGHAGVPAAVKDIPALWGNMLSFLAGPRACIGFRFSLYQ